MKRTKNMYYNNTAEMVELFNFTNNTVEIYPLIQNVVRMLAKHYNKGNYNAEKAVNIWYQVATKASDLYNRWYGYRFNVTDRFSAAVELEKYWFENVEENDI